VDLRVRNVLIAVGLGVAVAVAGLWWFGQRRRKAIQSPPWGEFVQPPDQIEPLGGPQSWAANRCRPLAASCDAYTAGRRLRRLYAPTCFDDPNSLVGFNFVFNGGI